MFIEKVFRSNAHGCSIYALFTDSDKNIFTAGSDGIILQWNLAEIESPTAIAKVSSQVFSLSRITTANQIWVGTMSGALHVLDLSVKREIRNFTLHSKSIFDIQEKGERIFVSSKDGSFSVWKKENQEFIQSVFVSEAGLRKISFHPLRNEFAIGASDNCIYIFQFDNQTDSFILKQKLTAHTNSVFSLSYSADGKYLLSGGRDAMLCFWKVEENYSLLKSLAAHLYTINDIVMLDENHFATAGRDKHIKIWNINKGELLKVIDKEKFDGHINSVNKLAWIPNEKILLSASDDRSLMGWKIFL